MSEVLLDRAGRRRSPATMPGFHAGRPPRNKGLRYPADPPKVEEIVSVMRTAGDAPHGRRLRGLIVVLWRAGLRIREALALAEADLDYRRGALLVRRGKADVAVKSAWIRGAGTSFSHGSKYVSGYPSAHCSASSTAGPVVISGRPPPLEPSCVVRPPPRVSADDSPHISCGTRTLSRWPAKACHWWSSSASSATATSASPRSTSRGSTTQRSSIPSTPAALR
jgi:hypothetical protein